ncbi:poly [Labeo rohita]|uniref:ribonuclease H n=1 Tax=Labeo rohita TaxID=84645 RepID=A0A498LT16_LABRO|nr:poly [Labeo rohita]
MSEIEVEDYSLDFEDPAAPPASVQAADQATSAPQDPPTEPAAASRGRRPSRATAARTSRRTTPSPPPSKRQPSSPASSYASALSSAPAKGKWTVAGLRQALTSSGVIIPRRSTKADLLNLYASLQAEENPGSTPPSRASGRAGTGRSAPYSRPEQTATPPRTASRPSGRNDRPSASLGHAPKAAVASHRPPPRSSERELAAYAGGEPVFASTSRRCGASPPPPAENSRSQLLPRYSPNPLPYPWPAAPPSNHSTSFPPLLAQAPVPPIPPLFPSLSSVPGAVPSVSLPLTTQAPMPAIPPLLPSLSSAPGAVPSVSLPLTTQAPMPAIPPLFPPFSVVPQNAHSASMPPPAVTAATFPPQTRSPFSLASATPLPAPPNALALEPPPVPNSIRTQILAGLEHGFHPGVASLPSQSLICPNLQSALTEPETVDLLIKKEIDANFMIGPYSVPPFHIFRVSPIGVATRKFSGKKRLIIDLSSPHNSPFPSINSLIPLEEFSLHYHDVDQAITLIKEAGRGAWLAKVDITSAFKVMPIHPGFWHLFGIRWKNKFYFAVRLTFGCRSSPKIFDTLSEAICWILSNNYNIPYLIHLLDDFLIISPPDSVPAAHLLTTQKLFSELGIPLAQDKTEGPSTSIEFLGINLDSQKFLASLPKEKIDRTILVASTLLSKSSCSKRELLSILGHLNFAMRIIPQGRPFISHLLSLASSAHALEDIISITDSCRNELSLWISFLKQWNGLSFFYSNLISSPIDIQLYTDAAPSVGFGGFFRGRWFASTWPPQLAHLPQQLSSSALFELYPLVAAASLWGKEWSATSIIVHCDNEATVHCINKEIQIAGTRGGPAPNPSSSLFRTDIPMNHPLRPLLEASINSILQAVSPRTLQSYLTAWKCFKIFHSAYSLPFPDFSLLAVTSFISHLNTNKNLQASSIKGYLSGIQFFHKLLYGSPSPHITNSQTSLLIKGYHSIHTARTLDAMFILAFFGFLRCSELAITSGFNPAIHPTISDLAVLDGETISYFIKQNQQKSSKTEKKHREKQDQQKSLKKHREKKHREKQEEESGDGGGPMKIVGSGIQICLHLPCHYESVQRSRHQEGQQIEQSPEHHSPTQDQVLLERWVAVAGINEPGSRPSSHRSKTSLASRFCSTFHRRFSSRSAACSQASSSHSSR